MRNCGKPMARAVMAGAIATAAQAEEAAFPGPLEPLIGHCWRAEFPGGTLTDTHCYRLVHNGMAVEDHHVVSGGPAPYGGVATYHYDPEGGRITYTYLASDGGISRGSLVPASDGFSVPKDRYVGRDGKVLTLRSAVQFAGADAYRITTEASDASGARPLFALAFRRMMPAPPMPGVVAGDLTISHAIVRAADTAGAETAAYFAIDNRGEGDRLLGVDCVCAETVELHTIVEDAATRGMATTWPLDLPAGTRVEARPNGLRHLMMVNTRLAVGPEKPVVATFRFERAGAVMVTFQPVADSAAGW